MTVSSISGGRADFRRFVGVSLGGGRGKTTAVARLEPGGESGTLVLAEARARRGHRGGGEMTSAGPDDRPDTVAFRDDVLRAYLNEWVDEDTAVAIDAPLTLPPCVACDLACPGLEVCEVPAVAWMRHHAPRLCVSRGRSDPGKPRATPYTQRATELLLERVTLQPRESLGQGMGPLAARAAYLRRSFAAKLRLHENLIEVHPRATLIRLFGDRMERSSRHGDQASCWQARKQMLATMGEGLPLKGVWPELVVRNVHVFHAVIAAFTAHLWAIEGWRGPVDLLDAPPEGPEPPEDRALAAAVDDLGSRWLEDGWIWTPPRGTAGHRS